MKKDHEKSIRLTLTISAMHVKPSEFMKKAWRVMEHLDYKKGLYKGEPNFSLTTVNLFLDKYEELFGNNDPNEIQLKSFELVKLKEISQIIDEKFGKKLGSGFGHYGTNAKQLFLDMKAFFMKSYQKLENEHKERLKESKQI